MGRNREKTEVLETRELKVLNRNPGNGTERMLKDKWRNVKVWRETIFKKRLTQNWMVEEKTNSN